MSRTAERVALDDVTRFALLEKDADDIENRMESISRRIWAILGIIGASGSVYIFEILTARANGG